MASLENLIPLVVADRIPVKGKKAFQKLVYLCGALGVPLRYRFRLYFYGPFSAELADTLDLFQARGFLAVVEGGGLYKVYKLGEAGRNYLLAHQEEIIPHEGVVQRVQALFGGFTPAQLELFSTVHFVAEGCAKYEGIERDEEVVRRITGIKGDKFTEEEATAALQSLRQWGLLPGHGRGEKRE